jgi:DNA (cytosine-5)-methyltransferase 1
MTLNVVSLYSGAGGLDLGFEAAGFAVQAAVEFDRWSCETLRRNRRWKIFEADIKAVESDDLGTADVLIGGPPCQPFSKSAYWAKGDTKRLNDPRADTLTAYLRVLRDIQPRAFLLENVVGLTFKQKDEGLKLLEHTVSAINREVGTRYSFQWKVLNAADYGVPQMRERVIVVGARDGRQFQFPAPTHCDPTKVQQDLLGPTALPWTTAWDAIGDIQENGTPAELSVGGRWGDLLPTIPEGENYLWHTDRKGGQPLFGWRRRFWTFLLKLAKDRPSWTVQSQPGSATGPFHWKNRRLSMRELCRIQTFPDDYVVVGSQTEIQRQLGNAVPSLLGEVLATEMRRQLLDAPRRTKSMKLAVRKSATVPPPEKVLPVPKKYLDLSGSHPAHPGTGKGHLVANTWG